MFAMFEKMLSFRVTDTSLSLPLIRFPLVARLVSAMAFVGMLIPIASSDGGAARVRSRRNAGKSSWRRTASDSEIVRRVC
jgi:hypothetical protein